MKKSPALYCCYSHDDGQETENASITHQKSLLKDMPKVTALQIFAITSMTDIQGRVSADLIFSE